jgi:hypothetical protein
MLGDDTRDTLSALILEQEHLGTTQKQLASC